MTSHYILIDYQNVQPADLSLLAGLDCRVLVFLEANRSKVPLQFACSFQALGDAGEYVRTTGSGRNALDFHIAFELGRLSLTEPDACFYVIAKDTGYDSLLAYLQREGFSAARFASLTDIPALAHNGTAAGIEADRLARIVRDLRARGDHAPRRRKTLAGSINAQFAKSLSPATVDALIDALQREGWITLDGAKVSYHLPPG